MADVSIIIATNADQVKQEFTGLTGSVVGAAAQAKVLTQTMQFLDAAFNKNRIDAQQYSAAIKQLDAAEDRLYAAIGQTTAASNQQSASFDRATAATTRITGAKSNAAIAAKRLADAQRLAGSTTNKFGMYTQQVGYQVGDFFVQVQSGTDALVAFGQQGTQLAGLLPGLAGAILGIGLAISTALGRAYLESKNLTINFKEIKKDMGEALEPIKPLIDAITSAFSSLGDVARNVGTFIADNFARLISYAIAFGAVMVTKVVAGFILSGRAARSFFALVRTGLIASGIGILVVGLGEVLYRFNALITATGSFGAAMQKVGDLFDGLWDFAIAKIDVYLAQLQTIGPAFKAFMLGILNSVLTSIQEGLNNAISAINRTFNTSFEPIRIGGFVEDAMIQAQKDLRVVERAVEDLKSTADGSWESLKGMVNDLLGLTNTTTTALDTTDWFMTKLDEDTKKANDSLSKQNDAFKKLEDQANRLAAPFDDFFMSVVDGTTSVTDAFRAMARDIIKELYRIFVVEQMVQSIKGGIMGALAGPVQGPNLPSGNYDGGGYTGSGPRSGGLDGKGGFMAMLHPRETVVDHTKGQSVGGDTVTVNQTINVSTGVQQTVRSEIKQLMPQIADNAKAAVVDAKRRGGSYGRAFS